MFQNLQRRKFFVCVNLVFTKGVRLTTMEIVEIRILFIPREDAVQTAVVQKFLGLFCCYTLPVPFTGGLLGWGATPFSVPLQRAGLQKDVRVVFLFVMWVLVSWNLNRCGRNLIISTSKQPLATIFSDWRQAESLEAEDVSDHDSAIHQLSCPSARVYHSSIETLMQPTSPALSKKFDKFSRENWEVL